MELYCPHCREIPNKSLQIELSKLKKTVDSLKYMLKFKEIALKNREDMLKEFIEENKDLKETLKSLQKPTNQSFSLQKSSENTVFSSKSFAKARTFTQNSTGSHEKQRFFETQRENTRFSLEKKPNLLNFLRRNATLHEKVAKKTKECGNISKGLFTTSRNFVKMASTSAFLLVFIENFFEKGVVTVTATQGIQEDLSIFTNKEGRLNLLQTDEETHFKNNKNFKNFQEMVFSEHFLFSFLQSSGQEKSHFQDLTRTFLKDFQRMLKMNQQLKRIIKTSLEINDSLALNQCFQRISSECAIILECSQADLFIIDESRGEYWTKSQRNQEIERIPFKNPENSQENEGILDHVWKTGKVLKVENLKKSDFVEKNSAFMKNVVCSPVNDEKGKSIAILRACNKKIGNFTTDDLNIVTVLSPIIAISLKNTLLYENLTFSQNKFKKFAILGVEMFRASTLLDFYVQCQKSLKLIMNCKDCQFLGYDTKDNSLTKIDSQTNSLVNSIKPVGFIQMCIEKREICQISQPSKHHAYNPLIDLDTNLSILTVPVFDCENANIVGVFQVVNCLTKIEKNYEKSQWVDKENLDFLTTLIEICLKRFIKHA